jgi:hypothetical protein
MLKLMLIKTVDSHVFSGLSSQSRRRAHPPGACMSWDHVRVQACMRSNIVHVMRPINTHPIYTHSDCLVTVVVS